MKEKQKFSFVSQERGAIITLVLIFGTIFLVMFTALISFLLVQTKLGKERVAWNESLAIAEAGANYARWHLAHDSADLSFSGTYGYSDPEGGTIGHYTLEISTPGACSTMVDIKSTGWVNGYPDVKRAVAIRYGGPSLAQYAFLTNSDVWIGQNEEVRGPMHSNGGIRMDGVQNALITSATSTYLCLPMHGCLSPYQIKPGIWGSGAGGPAGLWQFPVANINFNSLTVDFAKLKTEAQNSGYYFASSTVFGYHVEFKNNGSFNLYKVTKLRNPVDGWDTMGVKHTESNDIGNGNAESLVGNYPLTTGTCDARNLIFIEDSRVWVDGVLKQKATVAAAVFPDNPATNASIIINGNITRADPTDTMMALMAQKNILVPRYSPNVLEIQAVMVAQKGAVQRYYYPGNTLNKISVRGSIITNQIWTWSWVDSGGNITSGYQNTESYYEPALIYAPPPFFPHTNDLQFINWQESK